MVNYCKDGEDLIDSHEHLNSKCEQPEAKGYSKMDICLHCGKELDENSSFGLCNGCYEHIKYSYL